MFTILTRKPASLKDAEQSMQNDHLKEWVEIVEEIELHPFQYESFWHNPVCADYDFLRGKGGYKDGQRTAILLTCGESRPIVVDPSGSAYGRYVGFEVQ